MRSMCPFYFHKKKSKVHDQRHIKGRLQADIDQQNTCENRTK